MYQSLLTSWGIECCYTNRTVMASLEECTYYQVPSLRYVHESRYKWLLILSPMISIKVFLFLASTILRFCYLLKIYQGNSRIISEDICRSYHSLQTRDKKWTRSKPYIWPRSIDEELFHNVQFFHIALYKTVKPLIHKGLLSMKR